MKQAVFAMAFLIGVPIIAGLAMSAARWRERLCTLLLVSPLASEIAGINFHSLEHYRGADRGFEVTLTDLLALGLCIALLARSWRRIRLWPAGSTPMLIFFLYTCVSTTQAAVPLYAGFTLFKMVRVFLLFWTISNLLHAGVSPTAVFRGLVVIGLIMTVLALDQKYVKGLYRIHGPFDHSNSVPLYLNAILPITLMWSLVDRTLSRRWAAVGSAAALGMVFAVISTYSRVGQALAGACLVAVVALALVRARSRRVTWVAIAVLIAGIAGGIYAAPSIARRIAEAPKSSEAARDEFNAAAAQMAHDRRLGVGLNNFSHVLTTNERYRENIQVMANEEQAGVAHHIYWLTAAELGWTGLALFLFVVLRFFLMASWRSLKFRLLEERLLAALALGFVTMQVSGFFEWAFRITPVTYQFAILAALTVGFAARARGVGAAPATGAPEAAA